MGVAPGAGAADLRGGAGTGGDVRVALLGCGRIARLFHLPVLANLPGVRLVAVAEPDPAGRAVAADAPGNPVVRSDWREVAGASDVDAVVVCLPTAQHAEAATAAFAAGRAAYVEKPLAVDVEEARQVERAWRDSGAVGMVGFMLRFSPQVAQLRAALRLGRAGRLVGVRTSFCAAPRELPAWKTARATGGGALLDLASHHVDLVRSVFGEVEEVGATLRSVRSEDDTALLTMTVAGGLPVQAFVSTTARQEDRVEVLGDAATLVVDRYRAPRPAVEPARPAASRRERAAAGLAAARDAPGRLRALVAPAADPSFRTALATFADAVRRGTQAAPTVADGTAGLAVIAAAEESAKTGAVVPVLD